MRLPHIAWCAVLGILPLLWFPVLPEISLIQWLIVLAVSLSLFGKKYLYPVALTLLFFCWGSLTALEAIWPAQTLSGKNQQVEIVLIETDGQSRHKGKIIAHKGQRLFPAPGVALYGENLPETPCAGQRWAMTIRARAVHGQLNDIGFDSQQYALANHQLLSGYIVKARVLDNRCSWRARYLNSLHTTLAPYPWRQVILALGMGERLSLPQEIKTLMQKTGTAHLLAISGLHIALGASLGWMLIRALQYVFPLRWISWRFPLIIALLCAVIYALMTGLQPPAFRTIIALGLTYGLRVLGFRWSGWEIWSCCIGLILVIDPLAVLSASLWLSAFAVATLIFWYQWVPAPKFAANRVMGFIIRLIHLQLGLLLLLLPLQVMLFRGFSLSSMLANLFAVPLVTLVTVPLILFGLLIHLCGPVFPETLIWSLTDSVLQGLFYLLHQLPDGWISVDKRWKFLILLPWMLVIYWRFHAWKNGFSIAVAVIILMLEPFKLSRSAGWEITMLDVGQGLAMVISRNGRAIMYDSGPAWPGGDSAQQVIIPWLRWHNLRPEGIILSHEHLDHRGGLNSLQKMWPQLWIRSPMQWGGHLACARGENWQWQGLHFQVLWPMSVSPSGGNNASCVVRVDDGKTSVLLTGDIETAAEMSMVQLDGQRLTSTIIQVPHHGSATSSSQALIRQVNGSVALASAERYNTWRFPSVKVRNRYVAQGYTWFDTPHHGQITLSVHAPGWKVYRLRDQISRRWYHQWFGDVTDNR